MAEPFNPPEGLRRIVTCNDGNGRSHILLDGPPAQTHEVAGLHEIWTDAASGPIDARETIDRGTGRVELSPPAGGVKIRWFVTRPQPEEIPAGEFARFFRAAFEDIGAGDHQPDTTRHSAMHATHTIDAIILIRGEVRLLLDDDETVVRPGDVVVQRATNHAWVVEGEEPALFVAVLVDRS